MTLDNINTLISIVKAAGEILLKHYYSEIKVSYKEDQTPVTIADQEADEFIVKNLYYYFPEIPVISEEGVNQNYNRSFPKFWLVDPLDGTKSFIRKGKNFTINIGLIEENSVRSGIIYHPLSGEIFYSLNSETSFKLDKFGNQEQLTKNRENVSNIVIIGSHSSIFEERTKKFLEERNEHYELAKMSSSLKFCKIAEGSAGLYPRFGRTMEWDTAAGHAILKGIGGQILDLEGKELRYNKKYFANDGFIAYSSNDLNKKNI